MLNGKTLAGATLVFDLDGTLVDSARDLARAMNHALDLAGRPAVPLESVRHMAGQGALALIRRGLTATGGLPDEAEVARLHRAFIDYYSANIAGETVLFDGAREMLDDLRAEGIRIGLCTNKPIDLTMPLLEELGLGPAFHAISGGDSFPFKKPDPRHLLETARAAGGAPPRIVMIGDSASDIDAARAAGLPSIAVSFGYTETPADALGASAVIHCLKDVRPTAFALL